MMGDWLQARNSQSWVDAVLGACSTQYYIMIIACRDREGWLNIMFSWDGRVVNEKERDGNEDENNVRWYEQMGKIRGTAYMVGCRIPHIGVFTRRIWSRACCIRVSKLTSTSIPHKSQFLMVISLFSSDLYPSCVLLYHHRRTQTLIIPLYLHMPESWIYSEYSIHQVLHQPKFDSFQLPTGIESLISDLLVQVITLYSVHSH